MKLFVRILALALALTGLVACDSPRENATEEKIEDRGDATGSEDKAEAHGEAVTDGTATDTTGATTTGTTGTTGTTTTQTETSTTSVTTTT